MRYAPVSPREEEIAKAVVQAAYRVHKELGPGLLEHIYETCFCHELSKQGFQHRRQVVLPITYDGICFDEGFRLDVLVEDLVICELKAVEAMNPVFKAQIISYLKLAQKRLGFLINFNVVLIKQGLERIVV